ncbi:cysteine sulfinic acid decarboxylase [Biomphalaria pfeifferi]|uniref:Cysteine sulfinic acid decarboxylase n=1 Tax=Biomphalaria pfeifferi TaxID=112525 RepID=A0AAD8BRA6_BIOPF|nr:cysteine sulfinic acid decarboxylase [Biomphalaria pfeifferi]
MDPAEQSGGDFNELFDGVTFLTKLFGIILNKLMLFKMELKKDAKIVEFLHPADLAQSIDLKLSLEPTCDKTLLNLCHPHFFNQLYGGIDLHALSGAWLSDALNTSQYTYEVAPVFTLMEKVVIEEVKGLIGFETRDGLFCPGGSLSNMYALNLARHKMFPDVKLTGLSALPTMCVMTSEKGHYSIKKGAAFMGLGMNNVITVKTDERGRMIPEELDKAIVKAKSENRIPIMVNATAGTTVLGAFDPLHAIADICQKHALWMHVDGAWGASLLLSKNLRHKLHGIEKADSVSWNPHKMLCVPLQASLFVTRHKDLLCECHSFKAKYLFQQDKFYDVSFDTGDKSLQCGRKVDVLKLWLMWKAKGTKKLAAEIEHLLECASYLTQKIANTEGFSLVLKEVAPVIKQRMIEQGTLMIGYQPDGDLVNFFRMVLVNPNITNSDMDFVVNEIIRLGCNL